jgi:NAD(P)H dehydrogenase (quinone)
MSKIAVVYYSATGHIYAMAEAVVKGAKDAGAEVRLRRVAELAPEEVIRRQGAWREHYERTEPLVAEVKLDDLEWADGFAFGSPTRFGLPAAQLKEFIDQTGPLWVQGRLANKVATSFTSSQNAHGGQESTLLALNNVFYHWGCLIVPPAYTHAVVAAAGGQSVRRLIPGRSRRRGQCGGPHGGALPGTPARPVRHPPRRADPPVRRTTRRSFDGSARTRSL